jgi:hypothetical protein
MESKLENMAEIAEQKSLIEFLTQLKKQLEDYDKTEDYDYIRGARDIVNLLVDKIIK